MIPGHGSDESLKGRWLPALLMSCWSGIPMKALTSRQMKGMTAHRRPGEPLPRPRVRRPDTSHLFDGARPSQSTSAASANYRRAWRRPKSNRRVSPQKPHKNKTKNPKSALKIHLLFQRFKPFRPDIRRMRSVRVVSPPSLFVDRRCRFVTLGEVLKHTDGSGVLNRPHDELSVAPRVCVCVCVCVA